MSENAASASLHERYVLDSQMIVVLALGVPWMQRAERARRNFCSNSPKGPKMDAKPAYRLKVLKVSTIKGGLALKVLLRAPNYVKA